MSAPLPPLTTSALGRVDPAVLREWAMRYVCVESADGAGGMAGGSVYRPTLAQELAWRSRAARLEPVVRVDLKGRQATNTTGCLVFVAAVMVHVPGIRVLFMAPKEKLAEIQGKWLIIRASIERTPGSGWPGKPQNDRAEYELWANGSRLTWQAAGGTRHTSSRAGISGTPNLLVFSEYAYCEHAKVALDGVLPAIEKAGGTVIIDSTPQQEAGMGRDYDEIARYAATSHDPGFELLVLPWWLDSTRRASRPAPLPLEPDEKVLVERHGLDRYQLQWRRRRVARMGRKFHRVYIETVDAALAPVESDAWDGGVLDELMHRDAHGQWARPLTPEVLLLDMPAELRPTEQTRYTDPLLRSLWDEHGPCRPRGVGYVRIWRTPDLLPPGRPYLGVDPAEGLAHGDAIGAVMLDGDGELVATARLSCDPTIAAATLQRLATWYGAVTVVERTSVWDTIVSAMRYSVDPEQIAALGAHPILGTSHRLPISTVAGQAKTNRVVAYRSWINSGRDIYDPRILHEMLEHDPEKGKARTKRGDDDLLDALGIAASEHPVLRAGRGGKRRAGSGGIRHGRRRHSARRSHWR